jgi:catechol 2,3-dioxygenase-like lactoylglutathione lyase family enzyme
MPASNRGVNRSWSDPSWLSLAALAGLLALVVILSSLPAVATASTHADDRADSVPCASCTTAAQRVLTIGMTVADMDRSIDFYTDVLHFRKESDVEVAAEWFERLHGVFGARARVCTLRLGDECIELTQYLAPGGRPIPPDSRSNDLWFQHIAIIVRDMDEAYAHLRRHEVRHASTGPQTIPAWNQAAAGIRAFYFRDPDGHVLEVLEFPPDKGRPKWRDAGRADDLFLGIDHTAIVVRDSDASIAF